MISVYTPSNMLTEKPFQLYPHSFPSPESSSLSIFYFLKLFINGRESLKSQNQNDLGGSERSFMRLLANSSKVEYILVLL